MKKNYKTTLFPRSPHIHKPDSKEKLDNYETFKRKRQEIPENKNLKKRTYYERISN